MNLGDLKMVNIKGSQLINLICSIHDNYGDNGYNKIVNTLSPESRELVHDRVLLASKWYPFDVYMEVLEADVALFHNGDGSGLIEPAEENVDKQLKGMYRLFVQLRSFSYIVQKVDNVIKSFFQGIDGTSKMVGPKAFVSQLTGFEPKHAVFENIIIAFFRKMLKLCGAKSVQVVFTTPISAAKPFAEVMVSWD
jgi:hypothetical protein